MSYGEPFLPGYEFVDSIASGGYEWAEFRVYKKDGRLFYASASGCSCYGFEDSVDESDLIELQTLASAQRAVKEFIESKSSYFDGTIGLYLDTIETLRGLGLR